MQELSQADKEEVGRVPRTLEVELTRDLVDSCSAGDVVTALGIIKVLSTDAEAGRPLVPDVLDIYIPAVLFLQPLPEVQLTSRLAGSSVVSSATNG